MLRSLYAGVSGLKNHQTKMDVIGNNIANVNTIGFKSSRVTFQDIYSQTI
jgi:flagellar hook protein FlgE